MNRLILASISCLVFSAVSYAQDKPQLLTSPPQKFLVIPPPPFSPNVWQDFLKSFPKKDPLKAVELTFKVVEGGVCSVPLLEAHVDTALDPGIAFTPGSTVVAIPRVSVPAPACPTK